MFSLLEFGEPGVWRRVRKIDDRSHLTRLIKNETNQISAQKLKRPERERSYGLFPGHRFVNAADDGMFEARFSKKASN